MQITAAEQQHEIATPIRAICCKPTDGAGIEAFLIVPKRMTEAPLVLDKRGCTVQDNGVAGRPQRVSA
jgi:hypothetical protein